MNIYVSNLGSNIQDSDLNQLFATYGAVQSAKVIMDKFTSQSRGFGFVEMKDEEAANTAVKELNGSTVGTQNIKVSEARPREDNRNSFNNNRY